jgi:hypothetical protein
MATSCHVDRRQTSTAGDLHGYIAHPKKATQSAKALQLQGLQHSNII